MHFRQSTGSYVVHYNGIANIVHVTSTLCDSYRKETLRGKLQEKFNFNPTSSSAAEQVAIRVMWYLQHCGQTFAHVRVVVLEPQQ